MSKATPVVAQKDSQQSHSVAPAPPATHAHHIPWKRLLAGSIAGVADVWVCHPLDRIKTHRQNHPSLSIWQSTYQIVTKGKGGVIGGLHSLYEGILPMTAEAIFKVGTRYFAFELYKDAYNDWMGYKQGTELSVLSNVIGGGFAGVIESMLVVIPCELLKVRHMTQAHSLSFGAVFKDIVKNEGIFALYKGGAATMMRQCTNHMIRFPAFYILSNWLKKDDPKRKLSFWESMGCGAAAGSLSTIMNTPLDTIKTRTQKHGQNQRLPQILKQIWAEGGLTAYWAGMGLRLLRVAPGQAITWGVVEQVTHMLGRD